MQADREMLAIDRMEDEIAPLDPDIVKIRGLISSLELCHHKAERWVENIIEAIAAESTDKGLGTRSTDHPHPVENTWRDACAALEAWCAGRSGTEIDLTIDTVPASRLVAGLGEPAPLKRWQVQRVIDKIHSFIHWPQSNSDPLFRYEWMLLSGGDYDCGYRDECPERYRDHEDFWLATVRTMIHDTDNGRATELSLGLAIDMLMPCHWRFVENLRIVLEAIGGRLDAAKPFAACGRNITLAPIRQRMEIVCNTLEVFYGAPESNQEPDRDMLASLEEATKAKRWLAASLDKTIRLQLNPPTELRAISTLAGPDWIRQ